MRISDWSSDVCSSDLVAALEEAGVDRIQWDVMDGRFVPNLTFGPDVIAACRPHATVPFEAHLMVEQPDELAARYVEAGCQMLIVHRSAEHTSELQSLMRNSYAVFCLKKKNQQQSSH